MIFDNWPLVEADLHQVYGIDLDEPGILRARTWRWLRIRILGLFKIPPTVNANGVVVPATRIGFALNPPSPDDG